jgi:NADPH:quinone reductase-like Zn-dependent oxidoreductase
MSPRSPATLAAGAGCVLALALLAGCGGGAREGIEAKTPAQILAASQVAADAAGSVHVAGAIRSGRTPITLDLSLLAGSGARGQLSQNGLGFEVIRTGDTIYLKGSQAFYRQLAGAPAARALAGRWVKVPASDSGFASLAALTDLRTLIDTTFANHGALSKGGSTTIDGQSAIAVGERGRRGTIYVATTGLPYPVAVVGAAGSQGTVTFDHWNGPVPLTAPPEAIELHSFGGRR